MTTLQPQLAELRKNAQDSEDTELFTMASLQKRTKRSVSTPAIADEIIEARLKTLGMNFSEYVNSLVTYDCWAEKPHTLTGDACKGERLDEERLWREIIADAGKPNKVGSYFEHRVAELVLTRLKGHGHTGE